MAILRIRDENGQVHEIVALKGEKGDPGTVSFDELTDEQKEELAGMIGDFTIDQEFDEYSTNAIANKVVTGLYNDFNMTASSFNERINEVEQQVGGVETALDSIIAIQEALIGGASV